MFYYHIDPGNHLSNRVLYLQPGIHFYEIEMAVLVKKLKSSCAGVTNFSTRFDTVLAHFFPLFGRNSGRRSFLDDLLMPTLHRALAVIKVNGVTEIIRKNLKFDVPRPLKKFLHVNLVVAKGSLGLRLSDRNCVKQ